MRKSDGGGGTAGSGLCMKPKYLTHYVEGGYKWQAPRTFADRRTDGKMDGSFRAPAVL